MGHESETQNSDVFDRTAITSDKFKSWKRCCRQRTAIIKCSTARVTSRVRRRGIYV